MSKDQKTNIIYDRICLAEDCKQQYLLQAKSDLTQHKHSKTDIISIKQILKKLSTAWQPQKSMVNVYFEKIKKFYEQLRKQITNLIDEDEKVSHSFLTKIKYHHLPTEADSNAFLDIMKGQYNRLDRASIIKLINQAQNGVLCQDLSRQKQITNYLDIELKKVNDKVLTLKYVLLSKKLQNQLLKPNLSEESKIANIDDFTKIYSLFNSRKQLIRSAKLIFRGSEHQFSPKSFHNYCTGCMNCLALVKTKDSILVGGYSPLCFVSADAQQMTEDKEYYERDITNRSFIFSISSLKSFSLCNNDKAIRYFKDHAGPSFGIDLDINKKVTSKIGNCYECPPGITKNSLEAQVFLLEKAEGQIRDLQIWQISF